MVDGSLCGGCRHWLNFLFVVLSGALCPVQNYSGDDMRFTIVKSKSGVQLPQSSFEFYPPGGTIGRSEDNNFVLPDESRTISRLQLLVHTAADGGCRITNRGNVINVEFNGLPLEHGRQVELQEGDILGIGDYTLAVSGVDKPVPAANPAQSQPVQARSASQPQKKTADNIPGEIWDSLSREFTPPESESSRVDSRDNPLTQPDDKPLNPADPLAHEEQFTSLQQLSTRETDPARLFDNNDIFRQKTILSDTTPSTLKEQPRVIHPDNEQQKEIDPLALFGDNSSDDSSDGTDPFGIMSAEAQPLTPPDLFRSAKHSPGSAMQPADILSGALPLSGDNENTQQQLPTSSRAVDLTPLTPPDVEHSPAPTPPAEARTPPEVKPEPPAAPDPNLPPAPRVSEEALSSTTHAPIGRMSIDPVSYKSSGPRRREKTAGLDGELLQALLEGADLTDMEIKPHFGKDQMFLLGQLLSLFSQGTVALLSSRSMLKRGVNAEMTMILEEANNPFKLLPSGKTVLVQMFGSQMPGFMEPEKAVRDALIDLQAHQLGMIAGIRAIIAAMLQSFNPEQLEKLARQEGQGRHFLSSSRKAALWDYFVKRFQTTANEIDDDFHTLFGEAFLHAYDVEVNHYKDLQTKKTDK